MAIDPNEISTARVDQLPEQPWAMSDRLPKATGTELKQNTVQTLADFISAYIGTVSSLAFNPTPVPDGGTLPATSSPEFILLGKGTFHNVGGGADLVTTEELNVATSNGLIWTLAVQIPIDVELVGIVQTIRSGYTSTAPSENAVFDALASKVGVDYLIWGNIGGTLSAQTDLKNALDLKAVDSAVVHLSGTETITGSKTFTGAINVQSPTASDNAANKVYVDNLVVGLLDDRGSYNASSNLFPTSGGSGAAGAVLKGDLWYVSVAGTLGGKAVNIGDSFRALTDLPGQVSTNWSILSANLGYVPENVANKQNSLSTDGSGTKYATVDAVNAGLSSKQNTLTNPVTGTGTAGYAPIFISSSLLGNSRIFDDGTSTYIASTVGSVLVLDSSSLFGTFMRFRKGSGTPRSYDLGATGFSSPAGDDSFALYDNFVGAFRFVVDSTGAFKINNLAGSGDRNVLVDSTGKLKIGNIDSRPYKVYTALITQSGTSAPTAIVLENTLGGTVVWSRDSTGSYTGTLSGAFTLNKTAQIIGNSNTSFVNLGVNGTNEVKISTFSSAGAASDGLLSAATYKIEVYN